MKKATSAVLIFMILLTLTACGQKSSTVENESKAASGTTEKTAIEDSAGPASETTAKAAAEASADAASATTVQTAETSQTGQSMPAAAAEEERADMPAAQDVPPLEEQRRILEENRGLWAFEEEEYSPDWYYAFTDLDHNGLLEVLSASTQGSGIFTYAHFYEVLPDGSGIRNLYHADAEAVRMDDWPEIILESIPSYYDKDTDRYYYICTNNVRDGAAHTISRPAALCLKDGAAEWEYLAMKETNVTEEGEQTTYLDGSGNPIAEDDYNSIVETRFAGMEPSEFKPEWKAVKAAAQ